MRKGLLLVVVLLMVSCLMAAAAYSGGYVHNGGWIAISTSDQALLSVIPHETTDVGYKDLTARIDAGKVKFDFGRGIGGTNYGLQPSSQYVWNELISLKNNSEDDIEIRLTMNEGPIADYCTITNNDTGQVVYQRGNGGVGPWFGLASGEENTFKFDIVVPQGATLQGPLEENIVVNTRAVAGVN